MMDKKETLQYLDKLHVNYELREHQAVYNMAELEQIKLPYPAADAKNLFLREYLI